MASGSRGEGSDTSPSRWKNLTVTPPPNEQRPIVLYPSASDTPSWGVAATPPRALSPITPFTPITPGLWADKEDWRVEQQVEQQRRASAVNTSEG
jgi:hypothetical protein